MRLLLHNPPLTAALLLTVWLMWPDILRTPEASVIVLAFAYAGSSAAYYLLIAAHLLLFNARLSRPQREARAAIERIFELSRPRKLVGQGRLRYAALVVAGSVAGVIYSRWLLLFAAWGAAVLLWSLIRVRTPPAVLVLGTSSPATLTLQWKVKRTVSPARVVSLLDWSEDRKIGPELSLDCVRVVDGDEWWDAFRQLARVVPAIVLDARLPSEAVQQELAFLREEKLLGKSVFVTGRRGEGAILQSVPLAVAISGAPQTDDEAAHTVKRMLRGGPRIPMPAR